MKAGREHRVPLSPRALDIVKQQKAGRSAPPRAHLRGPWRRQGCRYRATLRAEVDRARQCDAARFPRSFRDWAGEQTNFSREVAEAALAHRVGDAVEQAYRRGDALEKRSLLMKAWADFCARPTPVSAIITPIRGRGHE